MRILLQGKISLLEYLSCNFKNSSYVEYKFRIRKKFDEQYHLTNSPICQRSIFRKENRSNIIGVVQLTLEHNSQIVPLTTRNCIMHVASNPLISGC